MEVGMKWSGVALVLMTLSAQAEERQVKGAEIMSVLGGRSFVLVRPKIDGDVRHYYSTDGVMQYIVDGTPQPGKWTIEADKMCWTFAGMDKPDCWDVFVDGRSLRLSGLVQWGLERVE
jgi:hypothetical protein